MILEADFSSAWSELLHRMQLDKHDSLLRILAWAGLIFLGWRLAKWVWAKAQEKPPPKGLGWAFLVAVVAVTPITAVTVGTSVIDVAVAFATSLLSPLVPK